MTTRSQEGQQMDGRFRDTTERRERGIIVEVRLSNSAVRECDQQKGVILPIIGAQGPCNDPLKVELPIAPSASCDPVW
eukprot:COSAG01_NODE_1055_length_11904_cov_16.177213_1_plen_77_part_10